VFHVLHREAGTSGTAVIQRVLIKDFILLLKKKEFIKLQIRQLLELLNQAYSPILVLLILLLEV